VKKVERIWQQLHVDMIYKVGHWQLLSSASRLLCSFGNQGKGLSKPLALLDTAPLRQLLSQSIQFKNIARRINDGYLDAVSVTACGYTSGESVCFFQAKEGIDNWSHLRRRGIHDQIGINHLLASSAIPALLPAQMIEREYFGDGALRQLAPISPALKLGAQRVMIIGVGAKHSADDGTGAEYNTPSIAQMIGHVFNSAFIDALDNDIEHLVAINDMIATMENETPHLVTQHKKKIGLLMINPSVDIDALAIKHFDSLPRAMRMAFKLIGATKQGGGASIASYLLFEKQFCRDLIDHGYRDAMNQKQDIIDFFSR
jgi:NTE family protein